MTGALAGRLWRFGRIFAAADADGTKREFMGFLEPIGNAKPDAKTKAGTLSSERYRLIAEPKEEFPDGTATRIFCGETEYRLLNIREIYAGGALCHRECVLRKAGGNA